jgi:hypothetical protein
MDFAEKSIPHSLEAHKPVELGISNHDAFGPDTVIPRSKSPLELRQLLKLPEQFNCDQYRKSQAERVKAVKTELDTRITVDDQSPPPQPKIEAPKKSALKQVKEFSITRWWERSKLIDSLTKAGAVDASDVISQFEQIHLHVHELDDKDMYAQEYKDQVIKLLKQAEAQTLLAQLTQPLQVIPKLRLLGFTDYDLDLPRLVNNPKLQHLVRQVDPIPLDEFAKNLQFPKLLFGSIDDFPTQFLYGDNSSEMLEILDYANGKKVIDDDVCNSLMTRQRLRA